MPCRRVARIAVAVATAVGCYSPNITSGGFLCSDAGACPEGFRCSSVDRKCYKGDAGPEVRMCTDAAPIQPVCSDDPASGQACNPACQRGCMCSDRCTVASGVATCKVGGSKPAGASCDSSNDDCAPGLGCVKECGLETSRCLQFCRIDGDCPNSLGCGLLPGGKFPVCEAPPEPCDPVGSEAATSCPHPGLGCYVSSGTTLCDCPGSVADGEVCTVFNSCAPGLQCLTMAGASRCRQVCRGASDCLPPNTRCAQVAGGFGYCAQ